MTHNVAIAMTLVGLSTTWPATLRAVSEARAQEAVVSNDKLPGKIYVRAKLERIDENGETVRIHGACAVDPNTGEVEELFPMARGVRSSPSGKRLAVNMVTGLNETRKDELHIIDANTFETLQVIDGGILPSWLDEGRLVYNVLNGTALDNQGWHSKASLLNLATKESRELSIPETDVVFDVSADGKWLLTMSSRNQPGESNRRIYLMRPDGAEQRPVTKAPGIYFHPRFSPDAKQIVYPHWGEDLVDSLCLVDADGANRREIVKSDQGRGSVAGACWSPDGKWLAVTRFDFVERREGRGLRGRLSDHRLEIFTPQGEFRKVVKLIGANGVWWLSQPDWR